MNTKQIVTKGVTLCCLLTASWTPAALADNSGPPKTHDHNNKATVCYFDTLKYTNKGSYWVQGLNLTFVDFKGEVGKYFWSNVSHLKKDVLEGQSMTVKLDNLVGTPGAFDQAGPLRDGYEVWPQISIVLGDQKDCHKHGHKLVYAKGSNRTIHFMSAGSTTKNNGCKFAENIANQCDSSKPSNTQ